MINLLRKPLAIFQTVFKNWEIKLDIQIRIFNARMYNQCNILKALTDFSKKPQNFKGNFFFGVCCIASP